jgi:pyrroloquinoline-quinone synthase
MKDVRAFLKELRREIETHPGVNHLFLNRLATGMFSREDYRVFAENHYPLVCVFCSYLERLLVRAPDSEAKLWLAKVLVDEYGEGSEGHDHATLYGKFLDSSGGNTKGRHALRVPAPAAGFIQEHRRVTAVEPFLVGLGAVGPGHEWAIPKMFDSVIPGLRRAGYDEEEIHYFTLHIDQDEDHGLWLEEALARYGSTAEAQEQIRRGALLSLEARRRFWDGVQSAVMRWRQPRSIRPDGPTPRTTFRELALTFWDGSRLARSVEGWFVDRETAKLPTLHDVIARGRELSP